MKNNTKIAVIVLVALTIIFVCFSNRGDAELDPVIRNAIVRAYMNGYADALELKTEEIQKLKADKKLLRQKTVQAASTYIITVENMNK